MLVHFVFQEGLIQKEVEYLHSRAALVKKVGEWNDIEGGALSGDEGADTLNWHLPLPRVLVFNSTDAPVIIINELRKAACGFSVDAIIFPS